MLIGLSTPVICHSREGGNPDAKTLDSPVKPGNDVDGIKGSGEVNPISI
jgi:hypothetical protein